MSEQDHTELLHVDAILARRPALDGFELRTDKILHAIRTAAEVDRLKSVNTDLLEALKGCDKAFVSWQVGQIPGRPEDILALITQVRAALAKAQPQDTGHGGSAREDNAK